jgi:NDP-sugar pyrophosphorylase family protein
MNIVIPMGGIGERFARVGYRCACLGAACCPVLTPFFSFPKPLVNLVGRPMIFWLLDNLDLTPEDRVYSECVTVPVSE